MYNVYRRPGSPCSFAISHSSTINTWGFSSALYTLHIFLIVDGTTSFGHVHLPLLFTVSYPFLIDAPTLFGIIFFLTFKIKCLAFFFLFFVHRPSLPSPTRHLQDCSHHAGYSSFDNMVTKLIMICNSPWFSNQKVKL
ncbi:hypothetical protein BC829DRAFT_382511 [Chytridium lagenaria]|nr:hypothetical protein BC829DRAFT_382511 [Chytridium lagenaria]